MWVIFVVIFFAVKGAVAIPGLFERSFIKNNNRIFAYVVEIRWLLANIQNQWEYWHQVCHLELGTVGTPVWCSKSFLAPNRSSAWQHDFLWLKYFSKISLSTKIYHSYIKMCLDLQNFELTYRIFFERMIIMQIKVLKKNLKHMNRLQLVSTYFTGAPNKTVKLVQ